MFHATTADNHAESLSALVVGKKSKTKGRIEGLKKAIKIVEARQATADALNCGEEFMEPFRQILVFLKAEVWRQENPEEAEKSKTILGGF